MHFHRLLQIINHSLIILGKKHLPFIKRVLLLNAHLYLALHRFLIKIGLANKTSANFLGYKIKVGIFSDFYWTFIEIFIHEDYYFKADSDKPYIIDCGGNIGLATLYFKWLYPNAKIDIYEIEPSNLELLKNNVNSNKLSNIKIIEKAVAEESGEFYLFGSRRAGTISKNLIDEQIKKDDSYKDNKVRVEAVQLSKQITEEFVDFLKMDIEGAESGVFNDLSSSGMLRKVKKTTIEYHRFSSGENKLSTMVAALESFDFDVIFPNNFNSLESIKRTYYNFMIRAGVRKL